MVRQLPACACPAFWRMHAFCVACPLRADRRSRSVGGVRAVRAGEGVVRVSPRQSVSERIRIVCPLSAPLGLGSIALRLRWCMNGTMMSYPRQRDKR